MLLAAVGTITLGQHWLQAVCCKVQTCPTLLKHFDNVNNDLFIHLFIHSITQVSVLLNNIRHPWVFGFLWALLGI